MSRTSGDAKVVDKADVVAQTEPVQQRHSPSSSISQSALPTLRKQISIGRLPVQISANASPRTSRNTSPLRKEKDLKPTSQPPAAAIQRALSASNVPQLAQDATVRLPRPSRNVTPGEPSPQLPVSPRVKSPPGAGRPSETKKEASSISLHNNAPTEKAVQSPRQVSGESKDHLQTPKATSRGPSGKSVLETVNEDGDAHPSPAALQAAADLRPLTKLSDEDKTTDSDRPSKAVESGSESGGNKSDGLTARRTSSQSQPPPKRSKNSYTSLAKARPPEQSTRNMTVETETVQSIPHYLSTGERTSGNRTDGSGTIKMKSSNETIRPKKERRQAPKKARSINQSNASTKADIFEARVANAVDEANSSDSDETFVYESSQPEPRKPRHHSRTPSVTSAHSTADQRVRTFGEALDERRVAGKRSMKFSNHPFQSGDSPPDRQDGTVRSHHARHYGRWGRGGSHASMFDPDSPFTQASKLRSNPHSMRHSRPNSPRSPQTGPKGFAKKKNSPFDFDVEGDLNERSPLIREQRNSYNDASDDASIDEYYGVRRRSRCGSLGSFLLGILVFALVVVSMIGFLVASNRSLSAVHVRRIENVLATEQEILLDLRVAAVNSNAFAITITDMDVSILGKSKYTPSEDRLQGGSKDVKGPDEDAQPLLTLGHIMHFDQALHYAGTPFQRKLQLSVGELRLGLPGNKTGTDGSARLEKMLHHPFELIVRGVLKYKLPITAREENIEIGASVIVHPEDGVDAMGRMRLEPVDHSDHWQWIDWDREKDMLGEISGVDLVAYN